MNKSVKIVGIIAILFLLLGTAQAGDWRMFHHDARHTGYTNESFSDELELLWSYETGYGVCSSPAVADGKVFLGSNDHKIYCLDEEAGKLIWSYKTGGSVFFSSPVVADGKVFVGSRDNKICCLDEDTGKPIWSYETGYFVYSSPAVADGKVFVGSGDHKIYCLDEDIGKPIWSYETGDYVYSSPAVADGKVFVGSYDHNIYCLDEDTGELIWSYKTGGWVDSSPAVADGKVFVGSYDHNIYCLDEDTGELIWSYKTGSYVFFSSPAVADGKIFVGSRDNKIYCLDEDTGELIWSYKTGGWKTGGWVDSSPAVADGKVFVGSLDHKIYCLDEDTGELIWSYKTGGRVASSPAVADGKVFVGSDDAKIYCFGSKTTPAPISTSTPDWQYHKEIIIKENSGKTLTDYQVLVELKGDDFPGKAKSDGADIRFTDAEGKELSYWIESWDYSGKSAKIWVKVPRIPANGETKITMRYGNPDASPQSNGDATFEFFDDFESSDLKADWKWNQGESKRSTYKISNGMIGIYNFGINDPWEHDPWAEATAVYAAVPTGLTNYVIEAKTETDAISGGIDTFQTGVAILSGVRDNDWYAVGHLRDTVEKETGAPYHILCVEGCKDGHCIENDLFETNSDEKIWFRIDVIGKDFKWYWKHDIEDKWSYRGQYRDKFIPENFGIWVKNWGDNSKYKIWVDYIFLHKYTSPEPTITIGAEQPSPLTPTPVTSPPTFASAKAAIEEAKTKISEANARGSNPTQAELLLEEAEHALENGDYNKAIEFARQAKKKAEMVVMAHNILTVTVIAVVIFIAVSVVRILRKK